MYGLGLPFIEKVKKKYCFRFNPLKGQNKARVRIHFIEYEKTRDGCRFISLKVLK